MILILSPYLLQYIFKRGGNILYFEKFLNRGTQKTEEEKILFCCSSSSKRFFWSSKENKSNQEPISFAVCWVKQYCYTWKKLTFFSVSRPWKRVKNTMKFKYLGGFLIIGIGMKGRLCVLWGIVVEMFPELTGNASLDQSFHSILLLSSSSIGSKLFQV